MQFNRAKGNLLFLVALSTAGCSGLISGSETHDVADASSAPGDDAGKGDSDAGNANTPATLEVQLTSNGASGIQRVNFAVPLQRSQLQDASQVLVVRGENEIPAATRGLSHYDDGSFRSVQIQVEVDASQPVALQVHLNKSPATSPLSLVAVSTTLEPADGSEGPKVWAQLPATWLARSKIAGPMLADSELPAGAQQAWSDVCDYERYDTAHFLSEIDNKGSWLYDRTTVLYKGYVRSGGISPLQSAYREANIYRNAISGTGSSTRIGVPEASGDLKYHYTQGMALHYLLTGDDRFLQSVEDVATRIRSLWSSPGYAGGADFWTERHAGFALLGYVWSAKISDARRAEFLTEADTAVGEYLAIQGDYPTDWNDSEARCFTHSADSHGEDYGTWGCSPWMSAILAEGLEGYALERGGAEGAAAIAAIVKLGRIVARDGRDSDGKPYYWLGVGAEDDEIDPYDEHWGEPAYLVSMAWYYAGQTETMLRDVADELIEGLDAEGSAPHTRSFNWQCRAAVAAPFYLK